MPHLAIKQEQEFGKTGGLYSLIKSFKPIVNSESRILVLGSMPGIESLRRQQYYAHRKNWFWQFLYRIFDKEMELDYSKRVQFLKERKIALWDVYKCCEREGSLDSNIRHGEINDISGLLKKYPGISYIFCNGEKAASLFCKKVLPDLPEHVPYIKLPSTSPANASIPMDKKLEKWRQIRFALEGKVLFKTEFNTKYGEFIIYSTGKEITRICLPGGEKVSETGAAFFSGDRTGNNAKEQIIEYLSGKRKVFDAPVKIAGTLFQKKVYKELMKIPYGETVSYGKLAELAGSKGAARAVGQAVRNNPIPLIVPCHRVIGSNGKNIGFMGIRNNPIQNIFLGIEGKKI